MGCGVVAGDELMWTSKPVGWVGVLYGVLVIVAQMLPGQTPATAGEQSVLCTSLCLTSRREYKLESGYHCWNGANLLPDLEVIWWVPRP